MLPGTGLPRLLDMGQCNDAYGAVVVATVRAFAAALSGYCELMHAQGGQSQQRTSSWLLMGCHLAATCCCRLLLLPCHAAFAGARQGVWHRRQRPAAEPGACLPACVPACRLLCVRIVHIASHVLACLARR